MGCAVPGQVDERGVVLGAGNLGWHDVPLQALLEEAWGVPAFVEQDANAGALGELWHGVAQTLDDFVFLALGTGIGAGIVLGGRLYRGAHHAAGELGDLITEARSLGEGPPDEHNLASRIGSRALRLRGREALGEEHAAAEVIAGSGDVRLAALAQDATDQLAVAVIAIAALLESRRRSCLAVERRARASRSSRVCVNA